MTSSAPAFNQHTTYAYDYADRLTSATPPGRTATTFKAVALQDMHYNFARTHRSLANPYPRTPAMAVGITDHVWTCEEIAALLD
jgi:YD repeat-containing protein